jgi:hypothetical protein
MMPISTVIFDCGSGRSEIQIIRDSMNGMQFLNGDNA